MDGSSEFAGKAAREVGSNLATAPADGDQLETWLGVAEAQLAKGPAANLPAAADALSRALELRPLDKRIYNRLLSAVAAADEARGVGPAGGKRLKLPAPGHPMFYLTMADFLLRHGRAKSVPRLVAAGLERFPTALDLHRRWLDALQALGRGGEAVKALDFTPGLAAETVKVQAALLRRGADMLGEAGDIEGELYLLERLTRLLPDDDIPVLRLRGRAWEAGLTDRAEAYNARVRKHYAHRLPHTVQRGLEDLWRTCHALPLPKASVERAWSMADQRRWSFEEWLLAAKWGGAARDLLRRWFIANPDEGAQIAALLEPADLSVLEPARSGPVAGIVAGIHLSPVVPMFELFKSEGIPFRYLSTAWAEQVNTASRMVIGLGRMKTRAVRELVNSVKQPGLVGIAIDTPAPEDRVRVQLAGCSVALSNLPPRLAFRYGCPTYWCTPLWRGSRVVLELARLPDPEPGEAETAFIERWMGAFARRFEPVMRGDPRNLVPHSKVWRTLTVD